MPPRAPGHSAPRDGRRPISPLAATLALSAIAPAALAQWNFHLVANSSTPVPGGGGSFGRFGPPVIAGGRVAFTGAPASGSNFGVNTNMGGPLARVADTSTIVPGSTVPFVGFSDHLSFDGATVNFQGGGGTVSDVHGGIFSYDGGALAPVVTTSTVLPPGGDLYATPGPTTSFFGRRGANAAFLASTPSSPGGSAVALYGWTGGTYHRLVDISTPMPGGTGNIASMYYAEMSGSTAIFSAKDAANRPGVYTVPVSGGPIATVIDPATPAPDGSGTFIATGIVAIDGANLCFGAATNSQEGVYASLAGALQAIATRATPAPGGGFFDFFSGQVAVSGSNIAFVATTTVSSFGLYVWRSGVISRVIAEGDILGGQPIRNPSISTEAIEGNTVAFSVGYGVPISTGAVYTATIPSPAAPATLAAAALLASRRRRPPT